MEEAEENCVLDSWEGGFGVAEHPEELMARVLLAPSGSIALGDSLAQGMVRG